VVRLPPVFSGIDHVGIAVDDMDQAVALYRDAFGMEERVRSTLDDFGVTASLLDAGGSHVELLEPLGPDTGVGRFIARRGPGLHHVAYATRDIEGALDAARSAGLTLIDEQPRAGLDATRVAFIDPKSTGGVLTELVAR